MSYSLGQTLPAKPAVRLGTRARVDPVLSMSSMIASGIMREVAPYPPARRQVVLRRKLNTLQPGLAAEVLNKARQLKRQGESDNQALFDGLRLAIANRYAATIAKVARDMGRPLPSDGPVFPLPEDAVSGLGALGVWGNDLACFLMGAGTLATVTTMTFENPSGVDAVQQAGQSGGNIAGCNREQLASQARIAEATAQGAEAQAAIAAMEYEPAQKKDNTVLYVALGGGALVLLLGGLMLMKKPSVQYVPTPAPKKNSRRRRRRR